MNSPLHNRRFVITQSVALAGAVATGILSPRALHAQTSKIRVGLMLPFTGTFAQLGTNNANGFRLAIQEQGGKLGGRDVEIITLDDEAEPSKAIENANMLVQKERVDVLIGTVHSGVQMGVQKVARDSGVLNIVSNAGLHAATRALCAPNIFRSSFANAQSSLPLGAVMMARGLKTAVWITWKYAAGDESFEGFEEGYRKAGGTLVKVMGVPFPSVEFQAQLSEIASLKPDVVVAYFAGGGAAKFIKDYAAAGLKGKIPLYGPGFLTEGILDAVGSDAEGIVTTLHYSDSLQTPRNQQFRLAYVKAFRSQPDVYAVHGYDAGQLLIQGVNAVKGDLTKKAEFYKAMESAVIDSPRGKFTLGKDHNPIQDIYLRQVVGKENKVIGIAAKSLADSGAGCKLKSA